MITVKLELTEIEAMTMINMMAHGLSSHKAFLEEILHPDEVKTDEALLAMQEHYEAIINKLPDRLRD